jgi:hypothetical protein
MVLPNGSRYENISMVSITHASLPAAMQPLDQAGMPSRRPVILRAIGARKKITGTPTA